MRILSLTAIPPFLPPVSGSKSCILTAATSWLFCSIWMLRSSYRIGSLCNTLALGFEFGSPFPLLGPASHSGSKSTSREDSQEYDQFMLFYPQLIE